MKNYSWPTQADLQVNEELTKPGEVQKSLAPLTGADLAKVIDDAVQLKIKELGIDKIDRRYLAFPEAGARHADPLMAFSARDLQDGATPWNEIPQESQVRRKILFKAFMRSVLLGKSVDESLGEFSEAAAAIKPLLVTKAFSSAGGSGSEGGYLIPPGFIAYLIRDIPRYSALFPLVTVFPTGQANAGTMPTVATNASSSWGSESTEITATTGAFGEATYTIYRHNSRAVLPLELVNDTNPAILDVVVSLIQQAMAEERDRVIAYGNGSGKPTGIYQSSGITDVSGITAVNFANLNKLLFSVDMRWHDDPSFRWTLNQNVLNVCSSLVDDQGRPILRDSVGAGLPPTLLGKPFVVSNSFPNTYIGVGVMKGYIWFDRNDMGMATDMGGAYFDAHQMAVKVWERADGKYVNTPTSRFARSKILSGVTSLVAVN
jgi:HK97 family phage major capsid protein